ncbi:hypothetical protein TNCV_2338561 [Trichonephila clavipes]|nr:hypothetical protein TNCV_2338561 [Trichonephila clavipes]
MHQGRVKELIFGWPMTKNLGLSKTLQRWCIRQGIPMLNQNLHANGVPLNHEGMLRIHVFVPRKRIHEQCEKKPQIERGYAIRLEWSNHNITRHLGRSKATI